jgi:hypothetical protein
MEEGRRLMTEKEEPFLLIHMKNNKKIRIWKEGK